MNYFRLISRAAKPLFFRLNCQINFECLKTPNPNYLKFVPQTNKVLGEAGTLDISSLQYAEASPLATQLFQIKGVTRVFYGADYLSIGKKEDSNWVQLKPKIFKILCDYFESGKPVLAADVLPSSDEIDDSDSQTVQFIKEILATRIRPTVQQDGGDVKFIDFDEKSGKLMVKLVGACSGCPSSSLTLKQGIQKMLTYYVPQIKQVVTQNE